jgi:formate dehydrogenase subunit delta
MMSNLERLVYMANQIARNFEAIGHDAAATATADHIASFWDPRMKKQIFALIDSGDADLSAPARAALLSLRQNGAPEPQTRATEFNAANESGHADAG